MTKDEFNKLKISDQINYINNKLLSGLTLTKVCNNIGIARSTVGTRASKLGYTFDKDLNQYILENNGRAYSKLTVSDQLTNKISKNKNIEKTTSPSEESNKDNSVSNELTSCNNENTNLVLNSTDSDNLGYLLKNIDILKNIIEGNKTNNSQNEINSIDDIISDIYKFKQEKRDYKVKSLRIDSEILNEFEEIAKDLSSKGINQQEFLNYILKSYIDFFKKINI